MIVLRGKILRDVVEAALAGWKPKRIKRALKQLESCEVEVQVFDNGHIKILNNYAENTVEAGADPDGASDLPAGVKKGKVIGADHPEFTGDVHGFIMEFINNPIDPVSGFWILPTFLAHLERTGREDAAKSIRKVVKKMKNVPEKIELDDFVKLLDPIREPKDRATSLPAGKRPAATAMKDGPRRVSDRLVEDQ